MFDFSICFFGQFISFFHVNMFFSYPKTSCLRDDSRCDIRPDNHLHNYRQEVQSFLGLGSHNIPSHQLRHVEGKEGQHRHEGLVGQTGHQSEFWHFYQFAHVGESRDSGNRFHHCLNIFTPLSVSSCRPLTFHLLPISFSVTVSISGHDIKNKLSTSNDTKPVNFLRKLFLKLRSVVMDNILLF